MCLRDRWSELEYFRKWYTAKSPEAREPVRALVARGQLEFALGGLSGVATEGALFEDALNAEAEAARWLENEFQYRCRAAYSAPQVRLTQSEAALAKAGGVEMLVVDGADAQWFEALGRTQGLEFLWETDEYRGAESRLFTHVAKALTEQRAGLLERVAQGWACDARLKCSDAAAVAELVAELAGEAATMNDGRYLLLWPLAGEAPLATIDRVVAALNAQAAERVVAG